MKDPVLVLGWIWAVYLAVRLGAEAIRWFAFKRTVASTERSTNKWDPLPALVWLAREGALAVFAVGALWLVLRDLSWNVVPAAVSASPAEVRGVAIAVILGWSLLVINWPAAMQLLRVLLPKAASQTAENERMGATIGVLERILTIALMSGGPTAIGLVIAAKTLARHKELDDKPFAERYLIGTMASVAIAVLSALAAEWTWAVAH